MTTQTPDAVREARRIAADVLGLPPGLRSEYMDGKFDTGDHVRIALAALDSRAGDAGEGIRDRLLDDIHRVAGCHRGSDRAARIVDFIIARYHAAPAPAVDAVPAGEVGLLREALAAEAKDWRHSAYSRVTFAHMYDRLSAALSHGEGRK